MPRRSDAPQPSKGPSLLPVVVLIVAVIGAALAVAVANNDKKGDAAQTPSANDASPPAGSAGGGAPATNPFGDIDNSPAGMAGTRTLLTSSAPEGLLQNPTYVAAMRIAEEGITLANEAQKARDAGDEATFQKKGAVAKARLDTAFEQVADWLFEIQELYPNDRQVAKVEREIKRWDRALRKVRVVR